MGSDSAFGEPFYKDTVLRNENGQIDLPVGTKVKLQGKHCVVELTDSACDLKLIACRNMCVVRFSNCYAQCDKLACTAQERSDSQEVYFKEVQA